MPIQTNELPVSYIDEYLSVSNSSASGLEWRNDPPFKPGRIGTQAGYRHRSGYWDVTLLGKAYRAHRVVWYLHTGQDPGLSEIDHIDQDKSNNAPANLRLASRSLQRENTGKQKGRSSKYKGVTRRREKWIAACCIRQEGGALSSRPIYLGIFETEEEAWERVLDHRPEWGHVN